MTDPRLAQIREEDYENPGAAADAQMAVIFDNLFAGYLKDPSTADARLRRDGLKSTADRLIELFGEEWWERLPGA